MSLLASLRQACELYRLTASDDGEGGTRETWEKITDFSAVVSATGATNQLELAAHPDSRATCTITTARNVGIMYADRVKCADGRLLEVISEGKDRHTPDVASFSFERVEAREVLS